MPLPLQRRLVCLLRFTPLLLAACTSVQLDRDFNGEARLPGQGETVVQVAGNYTYRDGDDADREWLNLRLEAGVHAADEHELGAWFLGRYSNEEVEADSREEYWGGLYYRYHWYLSPHTSLFLGPTVGLSLVDEERVSGSAKGYGAQLGLRRWVSATAALTLTPTVFWSDYDEDDGGRVRDVLVYWGLSFRL